MQHRAQQAGDRLQRGFASLAESVVPPMLSSSSRWLSWTIGRDLSSRQAVVMSPWRHPLARQQQRGLTRGLPPDDGAWAGGVD